jgi:hypothetical protein
MARFTAETHVGLVDSVFLDGQRLENVTEADDELGFAVIISPETGVLKLVTGRVVVTLYPAK